MKMTVSIKTPELLLLVVLLLLMFGTASVGAAEDEDQMPNKAAGATTNKQKKIWIPGATGSGPFDVADAWRTAFVAKYPEADITMTSVGSGAAQEALWGDIDCVDKPVDAICEQGLPIVQEETLWGLGDAPVKSNVYDDHPELQVQQFPACAGAVAIVASREVSDTLKGGIESDGSEEKGLKMTFDVLAAIFNASISYWDDARIQTLNPHLELPHERVSKVVREDSSGQTSIVTDALGFQVPTWPEEAVGKQPDWPMGKLAHPKELTSADACIEADTSAITITSERNSNATGRPYAFAADGKNGVALGLLRVPYSIGYMEMGFFGRFTDFLGQVRMGRDGYYVGASPESLLTTMGGLADQLSPETLELNLATAETPPGGFPVAGYAYWYLKRNHTAYTSCYQAWLVCKFVEWSYLDPQAARLALSSGWVVPPEAVVNKTLERLNSVMCLDTEVNPPVVKPALSYTPPPYRPEGEEVDVVLVSTVTVGAALILILLLLGLWDRHRKNGDHIWKIKKSDLVFANPPEVIGRGKFGVVLLAEYRGTQVAVKRVIPKNAPKKYGRSTASTGLAGASLSGMSSGLSGSCDSNGLISGSRDSQSGIKSGSAEHDFFSGTLSGSGGRSAKAIMRKMKKDFVEEMRYLSRLRHPCVTTIMGAVLEDNPMLVMEFMDHGSLYDILHNETMEFEGELSIGVLRDIAQGVRFLHTAEPQVVHGDLKSANILIDRRFRAKVADFGLSAKGHLGTGTPFWMAPELIRGESGNTPATDAYSFGIILYEVYARRDPYDDQKNTKEVLRMIADTTVRKRPPVPRTMTETVKVLMTDCLENDPAKRPTFEELDMRLKRVDAEAVELATNRKKTSNMSLFDIFPKHIAEKLQDGQTVEPEHKESVTIFFSDIVGFTTISSELDPRKVANMLDRLYTKLDALSRHHDIFKVETIGDAYVAVANLVKDQEDDHAKRIAEFALEAVVAANETLIDADDPSKGCVNIRVGFHSGSVVADVVGTRSPRYCLFGDTVNTASRMESNSEANRINCSLESAKLLHKQCPHLKLNSRGKINVKGKGEMKCYWVVSDGKTRAPQIGARIVNVPLNGGDDSQKDWSSHDFVELSSEFKSDQFNSSSRQFHNSASGRKGPADIDVEAPAVLQEQHPSSVEKYPILNNSFQNNASVSGLAQLVDKTQKWLRLKDEVWDDEVSV